ncbi:hypothetical protein, partial [Bradyrhizobium sp.]|uniref:hypothetical protein n=1 Tax=Bradyrhizobium sp. TaxID=376 RepID=UPI003C7ACFEC
KEVRSIPSHDEDRKRVGFWGTLPDDTSMAFTSDGNWLAVMETDGLAQKRPFLGSSFALLVNQ